MDILHLLSTAYGGPKEQRTTATAQLEQALESPQAPFHLVSLLRAGTDPALPPEQSLSALICAKNYIIDKLDKENNEDTVVPLGDIQSLLYDGVFRVPQAHQSIICTCISTIIGVFGWNYLPKLMPDIVCSREGITAEHSAASLRLLYLLVKRYKTPSLVPVASKLEICGTLITALPPFLSYANFQVDHMVLKVMECVVESVLQVKRDQSVSANVFEEWFNAMATYPDRYFASASEAAAGGSQKVYETYVRCLKRIAMISFSVLNDATKMKNPPAVAKHFLATHAAMFFEVWTRWLEYSATSKERSQHQCTDVAAMRYLKLCTLDKDLYQRCLLPRLMQVIESSLFPYVCYNEDDEAVFASADDVAELAQYMLEGTFDEGEVSARATASNTILALVRGNKSYHENFVPQILNAITTGLSWEDSQETFARTFGFLHLFSALRKWLKKEPEFWGTQVAHILVSFVKPRMLPTSFCIPLRFKATVTFQRYARAPMEDEEFASFLQVLCSLVQDPDARIRLGVIDAMCTFLEMKRARPHIKTILVPLVEECIGFLNRVHTTFVPTVLLYLVEHFSPELKPVLHKLGTTLVKLFLATAFDLEHQEETARENVPQDYWQTDMSACALLDALDNVVSASANDAEVFESIMPDALQLIRVVMEKLDSYEFVEKTLAIWLVVVHNSRPISPECWDLLPLLFKSIDTGMGVDFFALIEEVLDNYISNGTVTYIQNAALMEATYGACEKVLLQAVCCETDRVGVPQLIEALLHQSKHCESVPGLFDAYLHRFVLLLLRALADENIRKEGVRLQVWIVAALMDAFYYNAASTLHIIVESGAYSQFFDALFTFFGGVVNQTQAQGAKAKRKRKSSKNNMDQEVVETLSLLTRKVITLGLTSLLEHLTSVSCGTVVGTVNLASFELYLRPTLVLIQHCIFVNHSQLGPRCHTSEQNIAKIRQGVEAEDVEEDDMEDEDVLGVDDFSDSGAVGDGYSLDSADDGGDEEVEVDEGDNYVSPIDDVCEVTLFLHWMARAQQVFGSEHIQRLAQDVPLRSVEEFSEAEATACRYRELVKELNSAIEEDYRARSGVVLHNK